MRRRGCNAIAGAVGALAVLTVSAMAVMTTAPAGVALAASTTWTIQKSPNVTLPGGQINSVSCASATSCIAVGSYLSTSGITDTLSEAWNGTSWQKLPTPNPAGDTAPAVSPGLLGVSCPVTGFCEAVGVYGDASGTNGSILAETWNGQSWTIQSVPSPAGATSAGLSAVSCTSATFCEATGFASNGSGETLLAENWNGSSWSAQSISAPAGQTFVTLSGLSCASVSFCEATGNSPPFAEMWDGTSWNPQTMPSSVGPVSCTSADFCVAVGSGGAGAAWNGSSWTAQSLPSPSDSTFANLRAVSCSSAGACEAVGSYSTSTGANLSLGEAWDGTSWAVQPTPNPAGVSFTSLDAVSCAAAGSCEAGGDFEQSPQGSSLQALAEAWNGSAWTLQNAAAPPGATSNALSDVSCVTGDFCEAVGEARDASGNLITLAETGNGTSWKVQPTPSPAQADSGVRAYLRGVSCVSAKFCEAVGFSAAGPGPGAWTWNGTSWTAQSVPGSSFLQSVSCTSADFCLAAGGNGEAETWNGTTWSQQADISGFSSANSVSCISPRSCEAVGFGLSGTQNAAAWNGTGWSVQTTPLPKDGNSISLNAVSCVEANSCQAVGDYFTTTPAGELTVAERWNGSKWAVLATPNPAGSTANSLLGVWCTSRSSCTAVGKQTPSAFSFTLAQVWNGHTWTTQSSQNRSPDDVNILNSVWCGTDGSCTAVGIGADLGSVPATLVETSG